MKTMKNIFKSSLIFFLLFAAVSCGSPFSGRESGEAATTLKVNVQDSSVARTIYPSSDVSILSDFTVTCTRSGFESKVKTAANKQALGALIFEFADGQEGEWNIAIQASYQAGEGTTAQTLQFSDSKTVNIQKNKLNEVTFALKNSDYNYGGLNITVNFTDANSSVSKIVATLQTEDKAGIPIESKTFALSDFEETETTGVKKITYVRDITDSEARLGAGTYYLLFEFFSGNETQGYETLNLLPSFVRVVNGLTTTAALNMTMNQLYDINYEFYAAGTKLSVNDGELLPEGVQIDGNGVLPLKYSTKGIQAPQLKKDGYVFAGWFDAATGGNPVDKIAGVATAGKIYYARFYSTQILVSASTSDNPDYTSVADALAYIGGIDKSDANWTIKIKGTLNEQVVLSDTSIGGAANSITIQGASSQSGGEPQDTIDANLSTPTANGTAIAITTVIPVTLSNIKITGGNNDGTGEVKGGGLFVGTWVGNARPTVTLDGGTLITGNTADNGGGVYVEGLLYMNTSTIAGNVATQNGGGMYCKGLAHMNWQAVVGDMSATTAASGPTACSNYAAGNGGGLYVNGGTVYLGSTQVAGSTTNLAEPDFTGGIFYNYASNGGGVYAIGYSCKVEMYAGTMANNGVSAEGHGGAVYQDITPSSYGCTGGFAMCYKALVLPGDDGKHDIYLSRANTTLHIVRRIINGTYYNFAHDSSVTVYAQITLGAYGEGQNVLDDFNVTDISSFVNKFVITPQIDEENGKKIIWALNESSSSNNATLRKVSEEAWTDPDAIYVGDNSDDGDGTQSNPFKSFSLACNEIATHGNFNKIYTIKVTGSVSGAQELTSAVNGKAARIKIKGATGLSGGIPQDELNADDFYGPALNVKTTVPVTITNLKITKGQTGIIAGYDAVTSSTVNVDVTLGTGCLITENEGSTYGGGVRVQGGTVTLDGASVTKNTANYGAGVYVDGGEFVMKSGTIGGTNAEDANTANYGGAGVYVGFDTNTDAGTFILEGGAITNNTSTGDGKGVYVDYDSEKTPRFIVSKAAAIASNNEVYLASGAKILVREDLYYSTDKIATFMPQTYDTTEVFVQAESGTLTSEITDRFDVAPWGTDTYALNSDGKIYKTGGGSTTPTWQISYAGHYYVNLDLPSGTLWSTMNYGAGSEKEIGAECSWNYSEYLGAGTGNGDGSTDNWGAGWSVASATQWQELIDNCYWVFISENDNGLVNGYIVYKANEGDKGQIVDYTELDKDVYPDSTPHIYIPLTERVIADDDEGYYWASNNGVVPSEETDAKLICSNLGSITTDGDPSSAITGKYPIRFVRNDFVFVEGASIKTPMAAGEFSYASSANPVVVPNFYMCDHQVTQEEYELYCFYGASSPSVPSSSAYKNKYPVYKINWYDAVVYCNLRSIAEGLTPVYSIQKSDNPSEKSTNPAEWVAIRTNGSKYCGPDDDEGEGVYAWNWVADYPGYDSIDISPTANGYRIPSVAEYEYAARGGNGLSLTQTDYSGSDDLETVGYDDYDIHEIKKKQPNALNIYDMTSSISVWLWDVAGEDGRTVFGSGNDFVSRSFGVSTDYRVYNIVELGLRVIRYK